MVAFQVAGVILGVLARVLHHDPDHPGVPLTPVVGVVGAAACVLSFVVLGLLEAGVGRKSP